MSIGDRRNLRRLASLVRLAFWHTAAEPHPLLASRPAARFRRHLRFGWLVARTLWVSKEEAAVVALRSRLLRVLAGIACVILYVWAAMEPSGSAARHRLQGAAGMTTIIALFLVIQTGLEKLVEYKVRERKRRLIQLGRCPVCGYDLRASKSRCPECGKNIQTLCQTLPLPPLRAYEIDAGVENRSQAAWPEFHD